MAQPPVQGTRVPSLHPRPIPLSQTLKICSASCHSARTLVQGGHDAQELFCEVSTLLRSRCGLLKEHSGQQVGPGGKEGFALSLHLCNPTPDL